ncbi:translation initiation factor IF-1A [Candidatus Micrarchaeota archaeon]|nr:MAG: translation initiation factor IF-1A [Candidatus Micrarchaeota archaeon]
MRKYSSHRKTQKKMIKNEGEEFRVRLPKNGELFGRVDALHGGKRMSVKCSDGRVRMCRIPGRMKRVWVRLDDYVIVKPWEVESEKKGDIIWKYREAEVSWLKSKGYLKEL